MRRIGFVALLLACTPAAKPRFEIIEQRGAVAADMPAARAIGQRVLEDGGNAVDAAVAVVLALGVENPASSGIGGGGFAVYWDQTAARAWSLDFRESAPAGARAASYVDAEGRKIEDASTVGCRAVAVPGEVAGLAALHARFGSKPWRELVEPARRLASDGVPVPPYLANGLAIQRDLILARPELTRMYIEADGTPLDAGDVLRDPELAATLGAIARAKARGFYAGEVATAIEAACRDVDGSVTRADLAAYRPVWRAPVVALWRDHKIITIGPPAAGGLGVIEALNILEPFDLDRRTNPAATHMLVEAMKHTFADRATSFGDPDFVTLRTARLTSKRYAKAIRETIDESRTQPASVYEMHNEEPAPIPTLPGKTGTSHVSIIDRWGNAVALTTSVNDILGSLVRAPKAGVLLNDTIDDFSFPGAKNIYGLSGSKKNFLAPGRRPVSSMAPVIVLQDGRVRLIAGGAGGPRITTATLQVVFGVIGENRDVVDAVEAPRVHHHFEKGDPDKLHVEEWMPAEVVEALSARGHAVAPPLRAVVNAIEVRDSIPIVASDSRKNGIGAVIPPELVSKPAPVKKTR